HARTVVAGQALIADELIGLVALAGHQHDIAGPAARQRTLDGARAVANDDRAPRVFHAGLNGADDGQRVFPARVVVGKHNPVGQALGGATHARALVAVAIATAAEH